MSRIDLTDLRFGALTVIAVHSAKDGDVRWRCACDCGGEAVALTTNLRRGRTTRCLPCARQRPGERKAHPLYLTWREMRRRCSDPKATSYPRYGGVGVRVAARWEDFDTFVADVGPRTSPDHTLDRLDSAGDYGPGNCRWATAVEQGRNTSRVIADSNLVAMVKRQLAGGRPRREVAATLAVSRHIVNDIARGRTWKDIAPAADGLPPQGVPAA